MQLLQIEESFLRGAAAHLRLTEIRAAQRVEANGHKKRFTQSLELGKLLSASATWFFSPEGQRAAAEDGITWNREDFAVKVGGRTKSDFYKLVKAATHPEEVVTEYIAQCDRLEAEGQRVKRSIEELNKFAKLAAAAQAGGQGEGEGGQGEGEGEGESEAPQVQAAAVVVFEFSYKPAEGRKVRVKVTDSNEVVSTNTADEIRAALQIFNSIIG
jgi:hypothetical protein